MVKISTWNVVSETVRPLTITMTASCFAEPRVYDNKDRCLNCFYECPSVLSHAW
jgi:hypothetical protein